MLIQFNIWGEYDELSAVIDGREKTIGLIRVKLNETVIHEEECHTYAAASDRESAILDVVQRVFTKRING